MLISRFGVLVAAGILTLIYATLQCYSQDREAATGPARRGAAREAAAANGPLLAPTTAHAPSAFARKLAEPTPDQETNHPQHGAAQVRLWGKGVEGQAISISTEKQFYSPGEEVDLVIRLRNIGRVEVGPPEYDPFETARNLLSSLSIALPNGKSAELTPHGHLVFQRDPNSIPGGPVPRISVLRPGEEACSSVALTEFYDMRSLGTYTISAKIKAIKAGGGSSPSQVVSNKLQITVTDVAAEQLKELAKKSPNEVSLPAEIHTTFITDDGLQYLKGMTRIQSVSLEHAQNITDAGLEHLKGLTGLRSLGLDGTRITDAGMERLRGLMGLQALSLQDTAVTDTGLQFLDGMKALNLLDLSRTKITDAGLKHLRGLTSLQTLELADTEITDAGLAQLNALGQLRKLNLARTKATGLEGVDRLTNLQQLDISGTQVTDAALEHLNGLTQLQELSLADTHVRGPGLRYVAGLINLRRLDLRGILLTDADLEHLKGLGQLRDLFLGRAARVPRGDYQNGMLDDGLLGWAEARVTREGVRRLREALPNCAIGGIGEPADQPQPRGR